MSVDVFAPWKTLLAEIGELGNALYDAVDREDAIVAIATMMHLRRARSEIMRVTTPARCDVEDNLEIQALLSGVRHAENAMQCWLSRPLPDEAVLLSTPLGTAVLADAILPPVWDPESDLVVVVGAEVETIGVLLADLGQRRIIALDCAPRGAIHVDTVDELAAVLRTLVPDSPAQFVLKAGSDACGDLVRAAAAATRRAFVEFAELRNQRHAACDPALANPRPATPGITVPQR